MNIISHNIYFDESRYLQEYIEFLESVIYTERNPLNTELFFLWSMIRSTEPELFIESGTYRGYSASFICEALSRNSNNPEFYTFGFNLDNCLSYASNRLAKYTFARVFEGDSRELIKMFNFDSRLVAFFIDGPKGRNMPPLFFRILRSFKNISFIAIHDCEKESGSGNRSYVTNFFSKEFDYILCNNSFQDRFAYLDEDLINRQEMHYWKPYVMFGKKLESYGTQTCYVIPRNRTSWRTRACSGFRRQVWFRAYPYIKNQFKRLAGYADE